MALGGVDLNLLTILQALLEEGGVTQAAIRVGMPQPTASIALARLRRHYKDELLVRTGNGYVLTPLARSLLPSVQESMRRIGTAFSPENVHPPQLDGRTFSISLSDYSVVVLGELLLRRVRALAPQVNIEIHRIAPESDRWVLEHDLLIAPMGYYRPGGHPEVISRDRFVCVVDRANPALRDGRLSLADLQALPHAVAQLPHAEADPLQVALENLGLEPNVALTTAGWLTLPFMVGGTDMVAAVPERLARRVGDVAGVTVIEPPFGMIELVEAAWWQASRATDPAHAWLRGVLREIAVPFGLPRQRVQG
ncbi:MAG TPA: LysR family transcriptional regulator [Trebonia sp.]|jgi:DNA-binding transcriptional LysR family regulator